MALYYTVDIRGTVLSSRWALHTHWRVSAETGTHTEALLCEGAAKAVGDSFNEVVMPFLSDRVSLTRVVATAYQDPTGFFEYPASSIGGVSGDDMPAFTAFGFRQLRGNQLFRAATHRVCGVVEANNAEGSFVYGGSIDGAAIADMIEWFLAERTYNFGSGSEATYKPVLIRTQYTTGSDDNPPKIVTYLDPHEISDVVGAEFYGLTSQVSRKLIIPTS